MEVKIFAEFENGSLVSQKADSTDLMKIDQELIESVRFRVVDKGIESEEDSISTGDKTVRQKQIPAHDHGRQLLDNFLQNDKVLHFRQLRYLASKHDFTVLKLRFILEPFAFVFLLSGKEQYHLVLETLDTKEATYVWHIDKDKGLLHQGLRLIDKDLNLIRNKGRQAFIEEQPKNFSRLIHEYSDKRKGFVTWKDRLEERLI